MEFAPLMNKIVGGVLSLTLSLLFVVVLMCIR